MLKVIYYSIERIIGKSLGHQKIMTMESGSSKSFIRRVSKTKLQELIKDPNIRSVRFVK